MSITPTSIQPTKLHHVSRQTLRLDETRKFYVEVLGFREITRPPFGFAGAWLYGAGIQIHLIEEPYSPTTMDLNTRENHIAFAVADMEASEEVLKAHGIPYRHNVVPERGTNQLFFKDPDGWMIELGPFPAGDGPVEAKRTIVLFRALCYKGAHMRYFVLLFCVISAFAGEWKPITATELAMKAPLVDKAADAEGIFWEVRVADEQASGYLQTSRYNYLRIKIFTERGRESAKVELTYFKKMNISGISGRTIKPDGRIVDMKKDAVFDTEVARGKTLRVRARTFTLPDVQPGDIIEYQWVQSETDAASNYLQLPLQRDIPVETVRYLVKPLALDLPGFGMKTWTLHADRVPFTQIAGGFTQMEYHNMPGFKEEPDMVPEDEVRAWVLIYYADNSERKPESYWPGVGKKEYGAFQKDIKVNGEAKKIAADATSAAKTDDEKAKALYVWLRKNVKNVNTEVSAEDRRSFKPNHSTSDTLKQGMGTGYDINTLYVALATAAGLDAHMALTGDRSQLFFKPVMTDMYFLRDEMVAIRIGNDWKYYDPATAYLPCGFQTWSQQGTAALITDGKKPEWAMPPLSKAAESLERHAAQLVLDAEGNLTGAVQTSYTGHLAVSERADLYRKSTAERGQYVIDNLKRQFGNAEVTEVKWDGVEDAEKPLTVSYKLQLPNAIQRTGKRIFLQPGIFQRGTAARFPGSDRKWPLYFRYAWSEQDEIAIEIPPGYEFDHADIPPEIKSNDTVDWKASAQIVGGNKLVYRRNFQFGNDGNIVLPRDTYSTVKKIFDAIHESDEHAIALKQVAQ